MSVAEYLQRGSALFTRREAARYLGVTEVAPQI